MQATQINRQTFEMSLSWDLTGNGAISHDRVADILRQWVFETYKGKLGFELYDEIKGRLHFRVRETESHLAELKKPSP